MSNYSLIERPSNLLLGQANAQVSFLLAAFVDQNVVQSTTSLIGQATQLFNSFYGNLGSPITKCIGFSGLPVAQVWNDYQDNIVVDLGILYTQTVDIQQAADAANLFGTVETQLLVESTAALTNRISTFNATRPTQSGLVTWTVSDNFLDTSKVNIANSTTTILDDTIILTSTGSQDFSSLATLSIDDTYVALANAATNGTTVANVTGASNGFCGNSHEVIVPENTNPLTSLDQTAETAATTTIVSAIQLNVSPGESIAFAGDSGLHADPSVMLDGDPTTWFEYELCNIPDTLKANPANFFGFNLEVPSNNASGTQLVPWYAFHGPTTQAALSFFPPAATTTKINIGSDEVDGSGNYVQPNASDPINPVLSAGSTAYTPTGGTITIVSGNAPQQGGELRLVIDATFTTPQTLTQISILPYIINNTPPTIVSVDVLSADTSVWYSTTPATTQQTASLSSVTASSNSTAGIAQVFTFPEALISQARIVIVQDQSYSTQIGHIVWVEQDTISQTSDPATLNALLGSTVANDSQTSSATSYERVDGPPMTYQNILANPSTGVLSTIANISSYLPGASSSTTSSGTTSASTSIVGPLIEAFNGWRYAIGISDISFSAITYASSGVFESNVYTVPVDIKSITLQVNESIPELAVAETVNWFTYQFSLDGGSSWNDIAPISYYTSTSPTQYLVNPSVGTNVTAANATSITTPGYNTSTNPVTTIALRATLNRPGDVPTVSPRLLSYSIFLQGLTI